MKKVFSLIFILFLLGVFGFTDYYPDDQYTARAYDDARVIRVKYAIGETFVRRSYDDGLEEANLNLPIFERDSAGTTDGRLELYLGRLNYARIDYDTEVTFDRVPELRKTRTTIRIDRGGLYLFVNSLDFGRDIQIQTPDCGIFIIQKGKYQINVNTHSGSEVVVLRGLAEISGQYDSMTLGTMQKISMFDGQVLRRPVYAYGIPRDDFGIWNMERDRMFDSYLGYRSRYLDPAYADYEYELSSHGNWRYDSTYNTHIWIPFNPGSSWKPYHSGRWVYNPNYGYVWTSYDRWGWITHHYGRWHWSPTYGWYWLPGSRWSPAWVSWFYTDNYYGWCPLSRWNRPVIIMNNRWNRNYRYRSGLPFNAHSLIVIKRANLWSPKIHSIALSKQTLRRLRKQRLLFKGRTPKLKPRVRHVSIVNAKGKTVRYKHSGFMGTKRYKVVKTTPGKGKVVRKPVVYKYQGSPGVKANNKRINRYSSSEVKYKRRVRTDTKPGERNMKPVYKPMPKKSTAVKPVPSIEKRKVKQGPGTKKTTTVVKPDIPRKRVVKKTTVVRPGSSPRRVVKKTTTVVKPDIPRKRVVKKTRVVKPGSSPRKVVKKTTVKSSPDKKAKKKSKKAKKKDKKKKKKEKE